MGPPPQPFTPAPAAVEAVGTLQRSVTLDGGQHLTLDITLGTGPRGEVRVYVVHLTAGGPASETSPSEDYPAPGAKDPCA